MIAHKMHLFTDIRTDRELDKFVSKPGLVVLNVYSQWCGPCVSLNIFWLEQKLSQSGNSLLLASCDSDTIDTLERFNRTSVPIWLFVRNGKAINIMYGSEADEMHVKLWAELKYLQLGVERPSFKLNELQPVETEIRELSADISLLQWLKNQTDSLFKFNMATSEIAHFMPKMYVTLFGPHIIANWRDVNRHAEILGLNCYERRVVAPTLDVFDYINYACVSPLTEKVINEFVNKYMMLCLWRMPDSCTTEEDAYKLLEHFSKIIQAKSPLANRDASLFPNIVVHRKVTQFEEDQGHFNAEVVSKYFETIKAFVASLPHMELNEHNCLRISQLVFNAHLGESPYIKYPLLDYNKLGDQHDLENENFDIFNEQKDELMRRMVVGKGTSDYLIKGSLEAKLSRFFARTPNDTSSKGSDIFGEEGMDEDLIYLLEYLDEKEEEESDDDDAERLPGGSSQDFHLEELELPGFWYPQGARAHAALIYIYFPSYMQNLFEKQSLIMPRKQLVMAFKTDSIKLNFVQCMDTRKDSIKRAAFFNSDNPEQAEYLCDDYAEYVRGGRYKQDDRLVMTIDYEKSLIAYDFVQMKPTYVSPNEIYGQEDDDLFFGLDTPNTEDFDFVSFLHRQKLNFSLWVETKRCQASSTNKCAFFARSHYRVPVYKTLVKIFDGKVSIADKPKLKQWYTYQLNEFLYNKGLKNHLSEPFIFLSKRRPTRRSPTQFQIPTNYDVLDEETLVDDDDEISEQVIEEESLM